MTVRYTCKLELWDDANDFEEDAPADLVIDRTSRLLGGRNKYVDSLAEETGMEALDEKISAYRWVVQ